MAFDVCRHRYQVGNTVVDPSTMSYEEILELQAVTLPAPRACAHSCLHMASSLPFGKRRRHTHSCGN